MKTFSQYCQNCKSPNSPGDFACSECGTRLMIVTIPPSLRFDMEEIPTFYEDNLLERVTFLELRFTQVVERVSKILDIMLRQTNAIQKNQVLIETLVETLGDIGAIEEKSVREDWTKRINSEQKAQEKTEELSRILERILANHTGKNDAFALSVKDGLRFLNGNDKKQGIRTLERAVLLSPENAPLLILIGEQLFLEDKFPLARDYLQRAFLISPNDRKLRILLGLIMAEEGDFENSVKLLSNEKSEIEKYFCVNFALGMSAARSEKWSETLSFFKKILTIAPCSETHYLAACALYQLRKYKMALTNLQKAVAKDANFADAWFMLSLCYQRLGEETKAREAIEISFTTQDAGSQCLGLLKKGNLSLSLTEALPFLRLRHLKKRFLTGISPRLTKIFRETIETELEKM